MLHPLTLVVSLIALTAFGQAPPPDYGFDFITIGAVGNEGFEADFDTDPQFRNRGAVGYEYRIAKTEIRTSDWVHFANLADTFNVPLDTPFGAQQWGAGLATDPKTGNEVWVQFSKESGNWPVAGISWWAAATYANWLHNDKAETAEAFLTGAYDISSFGRDPNTGLNTGQLKRSPGAKYWIPSVDEWVKATHYDPDKDGPGQGGWWNYPNGSDTKPITDIPGVGETNADLIDIIGNTAWTIPVGSYPETQSPWGLLDVSGGASEWMENWALPDFPSERATDGASISESLPAILDPDLLRRGDGSYNPKTGGSHTGLRLASSVPSPSGGVCFMAVLSVVCIKRKRSF